MEPDELPYIVDLHRFLDREPSFSWVASYDSEPYSVKEWTPQQVHYGQIPREVLDAELSVLENARKDDSSLPALEKVASNASQQYKRSRPSASKKAAQGAKLLRTSEPHPLFNTGSTDALRRRAISGYRPPQSILELKSKDESLGAAAKDFRAKIDRKKALEEKRHLPVWKSSSVTGWLRRRTDIATPSSAVASRRRFERAVNLRRLQAAEAAAAEAAAAAPAADDDDEDEEEDAPRRRPHRPRRAEAPPLEGRTASAEDRPGASK